MPEAPRGRSTETNQRLGDARVTEALSLHRLATCIGSARLPVRLALSVASGATSILAMAPFHWSPVLFVTLPLLLVLINGGTGLSRLRSAGRGFAAGWAFGFGYHLIGLSWIGEAFLVEADVFAWLLPFAVTLLPAAMALYLAIACAAVAVVLHRAGPGQSPLWRVAVLALGISGAEWLRGHLFTGFPWNVLGYALTDPLILMQSSGLVGIYGLTLLAVLVFATPLATLAPGPQGAPRGARLGAAFAVPVTIALALVLYGLLRLGPTPAPLDGVRVRLVQPSIPQREKWRPELQRQFFEEHLALSGEAPDGRESFDGITHVVWPEASMPFGPLRSPEALAMIRDRFPPGVRLIAGALRAEDTAVTSRTQRRAFNSLLAFGDGARLEALYDKIHLVPFGEYLPFQATLEAIGLEQLSRMRGGFSAGVSPRALLAVPGLPPLGVLICYEAIFPAAVVQGRERPGLLLNVTNDGWFGRSIGPSQHFHQTRVRAVEEGVALLRAANNGITAVVDPYGRVLARIDLDVRATVDSSPPGSVAQPIYAKLGNGVFFALWAAIALAVAVLRPVPRRQPSRAQ